jgi:hypothetical protein
MGRNKKLQIKLLRQKYRKQLMAAQIKKTVLGEVKVHLRLSRLKLGLEKKSLIMLLRLK